MDDPTDIRLPRLAPILLVGVLVGLAMTRPGNLSGDAAAYRLLTGLTAVAAVGYSAWRFHGLIPAGAAIALLLFADPRPATADAFAERGTDAVLLATLALGIGVGSRQGRPGWAPWVVLTILAAGIAYFGWYEHTRQLPADLLAHYRTQHVTMALVVLTVGVGLMTRGATWRDRGMLIAVAVLVPAIGIALAHPDRADWLRLTNGGEWGYLSDEWRGALANGRWADGAWAWTTPWVAGPLLLVGLWRTLARGRNSRAKGRPPLAWLVAVAGVGTILAVGARPLASGSLALATVGSLLSVFGVADLVLALVERIELKPPEPGPSGVPRVR
jgi:hypothetical protein